MRTAPHTIDELRARLARELEVEEHRVTRDAQFVGDLGISSINAIVVVMALEDWFGIRISDDEAERLCTLGDTHEFLAKRGVPLQAACATS